MIAHAAVFSGKSRIAIMADMGVFCLIDRIVQLLEARQKACNSSQGGISAAIPHQKEFEKLSKGQ